MKKLLSILIIICLVSNVAIAGEWVLKKKDPEKAKKLAKFPGLLLGGIPYFYIGDIDYGILYSAYDLGLYYLIYNGLSTIRENYFNMMGFGIAIVLLYNNKSVNYYERVLKRVKLWNGCITKRDMSYIKNRYKINTSLWLSGGATVGLLTLIAHESSRGTSIILSLSMVTVGLAYKLQAKRLDKAVFEEKESSLMLYPGLMMASENKPVMTMNLAYRF